jgi:hypothetical protein
MANPKTAFPPVVVYFDGTDYWLADGFHRLAAWERIGVMPSLGEQFNDCHQHEGLRAAAVHLREATRR